MRGVVVMFGGWFNETYYLGDTWEWDGTLWTQRSSPSSPSARLGHAMAYDSARGVTVLHGGYDGVGFGYRNDTWEWDGTEWVSATAPNRPVRIGHAMAYDSVRGVTVLFGGGDANSDYNETWEWDGTTWTRLTFQFSPGVLSLPAMAFDSIRGVSVMSGATFDGVDFDYYHGTWEFGLCPLCDLNGDSGVDGNDFTAFLLAYGYCTGESNFNTAADVDHDGCVTLVDYQRWLQCYRVVVGDESASAPPPSDAGDLNADGHADGLDIPLYIERLLNPIPLTFRESFVADFTADGLIDAADIPGLTDALLE